MTKKKVASGALLLSSHIVSSGPFHDQVRNGPLSVLMIRRGYNAPRFPGVWMPPTGYTDTAEDWLAAASREVEEELLTRFSPESTPVYIGEKAGVPIRYFMGEWSPMETFPQLACNEKNIAENISFDMMPIMEAIEHGKAGAFLYADALSLLT